MAKKQDNVWEDWCKMLSRTVLPKYEGLARRTIRRSLRIGGRTNYDPARPTVIVPPPHTTASTTAPSSSSQQETLSQRWDALFATAFGEVNGDPIHDPCAPTDLYTDGSCFDNGMPWASAGWGIHVF